MTMGMRILYQSMTQLGTLTHYADALKECAKKVCSEGTQVAFNGVTESRYEGRMPADILKYAYAKLVLQTEVIDFCRKAEQDGFDAIVLGSFSEPFLPEIRSLLSIPVVSLAEASLLTACSLGEQIALITLAPSNVKRLKALVRRHGLENRIQGYYCVTHHLDEADLNAALAQPAAVIEDFTAVAHKAVEAGADLIVPAEGVLNLVMAGNKVGPIGGATVLDCVGVAFLYTEMLVNLQRRTGIGVGRRGVYATPPADMLAQLDRHR